MEDFAKEYLYNPTVGKLVTVFIGIAVIWAITQFIGKTFSGKIEDTKIRYKSKKAISFFGYFLVVVLITVVFSDKLGGFTVALGVAGAGIAFALQEVIASVAGWMAIVFGGFYKTGDRVQLGGIKGDVIDIGVLRTTLMEIGQWVNGDLYNGRIVRIANSFVFKEPVFNYSTDFPFLWDEIKLPVQFGSDYQKMKNMLNKVAAEIVGGYTATARQEWAGMVKKYMIEDASTEPMVTLAANDNWVEFTLRYAVDYKKRRSTKDLLFTRILDEVDKSNGKIKFASATFQLVEGSHIRVALDK
ncbi:MULTISPECIES: mechanosensitive ion channel family protein [unclassified Imperialibacter]|uniref:mechanosensitive ion channel family protein n=1 Tax=unclassified Imperialibacter TaxID=2629706 RepID=UPI00125A1D67|nr:MULTISPECIES: mechanosensitive ion channel family protein [unclassified Imperialibacter]CAD5253749.1 Mechanosensitive ion channel [Imperialibacter sp. 75]CAD5262106.1 Mechanosensitive ion channel [Imperialibacter sp. 89]VVT35185.1 Mechanosensitive ion channel [Imperialibacter sp. EC-SDR9]